MDVVDTYRRLVERARDREIVGYIERHHIVPRCTGGANRKDNIVRLTAREHFIAHRLLVRMYPDEPRLKLALNFMLSNGDKQQRTFVVTSRVYQRIRTAAAAAQSVLMKGRQFSSQHRAKISAALKGRPGNSLGCTRSAAHRAAISSAMKGNRHTAGRPLHGDHRQKIAAALIGKPLAPHVLKAAAEAQTRAAVRRKDAIDWAGIQRLHDGGESMASIIARFHIGWNRVIEAKRLKLIGTRGPGGYRGRRKVA